MLALDLIHQYIPVFGFFRNRAYDEWFTIVVSSFVAFILFGYVRWMFKTLVSGLSSTVVPRKPTRCHFCETTNVEAIVDSETDLCSSCGQLNAFEADGDYSRPLPELYHAQMNKSSSCVTPNLKRGLPTTGSPKPAVAPGNLICARCMDNQEKIVVMRANFVASSGDEAVWDREFKAFERRLEKEYPLCSACQIRVTQFVGEQDRQIAASVASTTPAGTQNRLFMAKHSTNLGKDDDVFVPSPRVYRRNKLIMMLTLLSAVFPLFLGPLDLRTFWIVRIFFNFVAVGLAVLSSITSPYRRLPWTALAILVLFSSVAIDLLAVFSGLKFVSVASLSRYNLQLITRFADSITPCSPFAVSFFAFLSAISLLPDDSKRASASGAFRRQNSTTTYNGSPAPSEPYVTSLLAETVAYKRRPAGTANPWRAFSATKSVYQQSNYSPISNGSASPRVSRCRPISSNLVVHFSIAMVFFGALVIYAFLVL